MWSSASTPCCHCRHGSRGMFTVLEASVGVRFGGCVTQGACGGDKCSSQIMVASRLSYWAIGGVQQRYMLVEAFSCLLRSQFQHLNVLHSQVYVVLVHKFPMILRNLVDTMHWQGTLQVLIEWFWFIVCVTTMSGLSAARTPPVRLYETSRLAYWIRRFASL